MYLSRIIIKNYKSIKSLDISFCKGKNVIVGRNNSGKSNIIKALDLILGESSPTYYKYENINEADFFSWKIPISRAKNQFETKTADSIIIFCELTREIGESLNFTEINKCAGFYRLVANVQWQGGGRRSFNDFRIPLSFNDGNTAAQAFDAYDLSDDQFKKSQTIWIDSKLKYQVNFETEFSNKYKFAFLFRAQKKDDTIEKQMRFLYREDEQKNWALGFTANIRNEFLQSAIIPSFRDPATQLRLSSWTWYGKLMKYLTIKHAKSADLLRAFDKVKRVGDQVFEKAKNEVKAGALDVAFPGTEIFFQFNPEIKADIYKRTAIYVDDGFKSPLENKGSGLQSATIIGLFNYFTRHVNTKTSALLCIEEPELYLHPHARRVISDRLDDFLDENKNQVILSTHSSEFIRTTKEDLNVIHVTKNSIDGTIAKPIQIKNYKFLLLDNNQNELFFADKVIICEGYENYVLKWIADEKFAKHLDENNISVVVVRGKDNLCNLAKLVRGIGLECYLMSDFDFFLRDKSDDAEKYNAKKHDSLESLSLEFFEQKCILGNKGNGVFKKIQKIRANIKKVLPDKFYQAKSIEEFNGCYSKFAELCDIIKQLRTQGLCILSKEIEDFARDQNFISRSNKLDLEKIFEISRRLDLGEKISNIFDCSEIQEFLSWVFRK